MKLFLAEPGSDRARSLWTGEAPIASSWITFSETCAAIAAAHRSGRISSDALSRALERLDGEWRTLFVLDLDEYAARTAGSLAVTHGLRGMDAIHLASALLLATAKPVVVTWDVVLRRAAQAEGLAVAA